MLIRFCFKFIIHLSNLTYKGCYICQVRCQKEIVYVIQEIAGSQAGTPKINIMGASKYGDFKFLLPRIFTNDFSPGPLIYKLRQGLKNFNENDHLLLTGDPAIIGVACSIVSDITNGKYKLLKWDKQERKYYPIAINLYEKGEIDGN
jgi:MinD superfamily P-loop ATPase